MEEYRKNTPQGEYVYRVKETETGMKKLETVSPNGYVSESPYDFLSFHLMPWGYVEVFENFFSIQIDNGESIWKYVHGSEIFSKDGRFGCQKDGIEVFPPVADQIEFVERGEAVFIMKGKRYALLRKCGTSVFSDNYDPDNGFFYENGLEGWRKDGKILIPADYDSIDKWYDMKVWRLEKDGAVSYVDANMHPLFDGIPPIDGIGPEEEQFPYPTSEDDELFVTTQFASPSDSGTNIVLSDVGERYIINRLSKGMIRDRLLGGSGALSVRDKDLELFDNDFSYEFCAFEAKTQSSAPVEDLLSQFARLGAHSNSWHYLIGISVPVGYKIAAEQLRYLRRYFQTLKSRTLSLKVSIKEDASLPEGCITALMVTHYNERCWPAMFESDWVDDFNKCTLDELIKKEKTLKATIRNDVKKEYQKEVYQDQFIVPFYNVRYYSGRGWKESRKVLDWFLERNPEGADNVSSYVNTLADFYCNANVSSLEYAYKVLKWALSHGGNPNKIEDGKTPLDQILDKLSIDWEKGNGWTSKRNIPHFDRKFGILEKCRDLLVSYGAKTIEQLYSEEPVPPILSDEIALLREYCNQL